MTNPIGIRDTAIMFMFHNKPNMQANQAIFEIN
jgi:hypothetical protein